VGLCWLLLSAVTLVRAEKKDKEPEGKVVDTGSFGVFMNGHRIATEKFSIQQNSTGSVATSEFKTEEGVAQAAHFF